MIGGESERAQCPRCQSERVWRDGLRNNSNEVIQRFICRECGYRFSDSGLWLGFSSSSEIEVSCQVCDGESKNLIVVPENGTTGEILDIKSLLFNYSWELKKQGNAPQTIERRVRALKTLAKRGVNLFDPESVKLGIAQQNWTNKSKNNTADAYTILLKMLGKTWEKPKYIIREFRITSSQLPLG